MLRLQLIAIAIFLTSIGNWGVEASIPYCADACVTLATDFDYAGCLHTDDLYYACGWASPEFLGTIAICIYSHCNPDEWSYVAQGKGSHKGSPDNGKIDEVAIVMDRNLENLALAKYVTEDARV
jgi:CFEM domain